MPSYRDLKEALDHQALLMAEKNDYEDDMEDDEDWEDDEEEDDDEEEMDEDVELIQAGVEECRAALGSLERITESGQSERLADFVAAMTEALAKITHGVGRTDISEVLQSISADISETFEENVAAYRNVEIAVPRGARQEESLTKAPLARGAVLSEASQQLAHSIRQRMFG